MNLDMSLDINVLRSVATLVCFVAFLVIVRWAWSRRQAVAFEEAAYLPFADETDRPQTERGSEA
jgi:cytochrome c oxidase cbb3-type subunit 4